MRLIIAAIGKMRAGPEKTLAGDYQDRASAIARNIGFSGPDILEFETPAKLKGAKKRAREGAMLYGAAPPGSVLIRLDERGRNYSSEALAEMLARQRDDGAGAAAFLIGGADGHDQSITDRAALSLCFGVATWPHMLVRVMLMEQLYRAMTILTGHPYHRS
ncbi:MAG: 23S rRNA (pseudouridine(1915)-N(3))-methyltransferase RlmH [Alphaproteobacteria bacterium]|nr:23S rRNA (pseudouridine(1915)-N(3))-methyltransferase RlmH [Alphaproteobacteria bacterium]